MFQHTCIFINTTVRTSNLAQVISISKRTDNFFFFAVISAAYSETHIEHIKHLMAKLLGYVKINRTCSHHWALKRLNRFVKYML
jgi:hypothetical protein